MSNCTFQSNYLHGSGYGARVAGDPWSFKVAFRENVNTLSVAEPFSFTASLYDQFGNLIVDDQAEFLFELRVYNQSHHTVVAEDVKVSKIGKATIHAKVFGNPGMLCLTFTINDNLCLIF